MCRRESEEPEGVSIDFDPTKGCDHSHFDYEDMLRSKALQQRVIYLDEDVGVMVAATINRELGVLSAKPEPITLRISSNGGKVESELAIIDAIQAAQRAGCEIIGEVYGHGMSAAFMILQACDKRRMGRNAILMVHGITSWAMGDLKDLKAEQKMLTHLHISGAQGISHRNTAAEGSKYTTEEFWLRILQDNVPVYLFPEEALEWGVVDEVV